MAPSGTPSQHVGKRRYFSASTECMSGRRGVVQLDGCTELALKQLDRSYPRGAGITGIDRTATCAARRTSSFVQYAQIVLDELVARFQPTCLTEFASRPSPVAAQQIGITAVVVERDARPIQLHHLPVGPVRQLEPPQLIVGSGQPQPGFRIAWLRFDNVPEGLFRKPVVPLAELRACDMQFAGLRRHVTGSHHSIRSRERSCNSAGIKVGIDLAVAACQRKGKRPHRHQHRSAPPWRLRRLYRLHTSHDVLTLTC